MVHDATLARLADNNIAVSDLRYTDLRDLDVGSWFGREYRGERIPHLSEVLALMGDAVYYDIELKAVSAKIVNKVAIALEKYGLTRRAVLSSFSPRVTDHRRVFASMAPILTPSYPLRYFSWRTLHRRSIAPAYLKPDIAFFQRRRGFRGLVRELQRQAISWIPWTINDPEVGRFCLENGAAGLISDDPVRLARELGLPLA